MIVYDYTVKICRQTLNTSKTAKDIPYFYKAESPDLRDLTTDQVNKLYLEAQDITARIEQYLSEKG